MQSCVEYGSILYTPRGTTTALYEGARPKIRKFCKPTLNPKLLNPKRETRGLVDSGDGWLVGLKLQASAIMGSFRWTAVATRS